MPRDTSLSAYRSLDLVRSEADLMRLVYRHFPLPAQFTRKELSARTGWEINRICGRVNALVQKGYLKEYDQTRDGGHLLSVAPPKAAAPARSATLPADSPADALPGAAAPDESMFYDDKGEPFYVMVGYGPGWPPDQDERRRGK